MSTPNCPLTLRIPKGSRLTHAELDNNFLSLRNCINNLENTFVTGSTFNYSTYDLTLFRNDGNTIVQNLAGLANDIYVTSGQYDPQTGNVVFTNVSGGTFTVSGFTTGFTNYYTTDVTLIDSTLVFDRNDSLSAYTVDLSSLGQTGSTLVPLIYNQSLDAPNTSIQPAFGTSTIDSGSTYSSILGGKNNVISDSSGYSFIGGGYQNTNTGSRSSIVGGSNNTNSSDYSSIVGGKNNTNSGYNSLIGGGDGIVISGNSLNYSNIVNGKGNIITSNSSGYNLFYHNSIINGKNNGILNAYASEIIGGFNNNIQNGILTNSIVGGQNNYIGQPSFNDGWDGNFLNAKFALGIPTIGNFIGNGWGNRIESNAFSAILGGLYNRISGTTNDASSQPYGKSTIVGGMNNQIIGLNSAYSSILGGQNNLINNINNVHIIGSNITGTTANTTYVNNLSVEDDLFIPNPTVPSTSGDTGTKGQIAYDNDWIYVCVQNNTWKRAQLNAW